MIGFLNVYKPKGITSSAVVGKIRKKFNIKKIGHMGTLDPMAEGILPLAVGKATRMFDYFLNKTKSYLATFEFGYETDSLDATGSIVDECNEIPTKSSLETAIQDKFIGKIKQIPPAFSAKHVNGVRAYDLARNGQIVELEPADVEIFDYKLVNQICENKFEFLICCSSGTYIRSLARDLAKETNSLATMIKLVRIEQGVFNLESSKSLDEILSLNKLDDIIIPVDKVFKNYNHLNLNKKEFEKLRNGVRIDYNKITSPTFLYFENDIVGVAGYENGKLFVKTFLMED